MGPRFVKNKEMGEKITGDKAIPFVDEEMIALGGDRFLVKSPRFADGIATFFFGQDTKGRATNLNFGLRTSRRVDSIRVDIIK
jgi:hypothetical protein